MSVVHGNLEINAFVECPNAECENPIDLFTIEELTDEGWLYEKLLGKRFGNSNLDISVTCEECKTQFKVGAMELKELSVRH